MCVVGHDQEAVVTGFSRVYVWAAIDAGASATWPSRLRGDALRSSAQEVDRVAALGWGAVMRVQHEA